MQKRLAVVDGERIAKLVFPSKGSDGVVVRASTKIPNMD